IGRASELYAKEEANGAAGFAAAPKAPLGPPYRHVRARREGEAEQTLGRVERGRDDVVEREVGLEVGLIEVVARLAQLLGVVAPVPRREAEVSALLVHDRLERVALGERARP